jgi:hypothetical protein
VDWETIRPALVELFQNISGLRTAWRDKRRELADPKLQAVCLLHVRQTQELGVDDIRHTYDAAGDATATSIEFSVAGLRKVFLDVRVESYRQDDDKFAYNAMGRIRTGLSFPSSKAALRAVELSVKKAGNAIDFPTSSLTEGLEFDDRVTSVAQLDLELNAISCVDDPTKTTWIETVDDPVGTFLPDP